MKFQPGYSGNPGGRPPGRPDRRSALRESIAIHAAAIIDRLVEAAKAGDTRAAEILLSRSLAPLRPQTEAIALNLRTVADARTVAAAALEAAACGELSPEVARALIEVSESATRVRLLHELEVRVSELERTRGAKR